MTRRTIALCSLLLACGQCLAEQIAEVDTFLAGPLADAYIGQEFRADVTRAMLAAQRGDDAAAWAALSAALAFCDGQKGSDRAPVFSVTSEAEAKQYLAQAAAGVRPTFVDHACPAAYKSAAFLSVRAKASDAAFRYLDRAQALAPHWAEPLAERAYLVGSLGDRAASLALYQQALALVHTYPGSAYLKPLVLRGIGFALIELDRLDDAQQALEASLLVEPGNAIALNELAYIAQLRAKQAAGAASQ